MMYNELRKVHIEEKRSNNISQLKEDFYIEVNEYIEKTKKKVNEDADPAVRRELENCLKILNEVQKKRIEKILLYGFNEIYNGFDPLENLTSEEKELYEEIKGDVTKIKKRFEKKTTKKTVKKVAKPKVAKKKTVKKAVKKKK